MGKGVFPFLPLSFGYIRTEILRMSGEIMRYSRGDVVEFIVGSNEKHTGQVRFVEEEYNENILYVDSFSGWAYKVTEKRIISQVSTRNTGKYSERKRFSEKK